MDEHDRTRVRLFCERYVGQGIAVVDKAEAFPGKDIFVGKTRRVLPEVSVRHKDHRVLVYRVYHLHRVAHHLRAALVDYEQIRQHAKRLASKLKDGAEGSLGTPGAKLTFTFRGELEIDDGLVDKEDVAAGNNMTGVPPGNVFKEVEPKSATGKIHLGSFRNAYGEVDGGMLHFEKGRLKDWRSEKSQDVLDSMYANLKEKERTLYGFTIGLNPKIRFGYGMNGSSTDGIVMSCGGRAIPIAAPSLRVGGRTLVSGGVVR